MVKRTCFVISPIGDEGSTTRAAADDLFELVIQPALEKYNFEVIRADRIRRTTLITADIVKLVQSADLCIIDLTEHNPNVFYECGRRHETGKPYIHLLKRGESRPFDVAGLRDITYDLTTPRSVHEARIAIQGFVDELEKGGFANVSAGDSLASIAGAIERLERTVTNLAAAITKLPSAAPTEEDGLPELLKNPVEGFTEALTAGDLPRAERYLSRYEQVMGASQSVLEMAVVLAPSASPVAIATIERCLRSELRRFEIGLVARACGALLSHYSLLDRESDAVPVVQDIVTRALEEISDMADAEKALLLNQLGRAYSRAGDIARAIELQEEAATLDPDEPVYLYNLSLNYEQLNLAQKAFEAVCRYTQLATGLDDDDRLYRAVDLFAKAGDGEQTRSLFAVTSERYPAKAKMLLAKPHVRELLQRA